MQSKAEVKSSPLLVIKLPVPLELLTGNELLQLQRHVHGEGDDVVIENHPEQEHLQDPDKGDLLQLVQIPDPGIGDIGSQRVAPVHLIAKDTRKIFPENDLTEDCIPKCVFDFTCVQASGCWSC